MKDFKKDSLVENYDRMVAAKNDRLSEANSFLGPGFVREQEPPVSGGDREAQKRALVSQISKFAGYGMDDVADIFLDVLTDINFHTERKYFERIFADLEQNDWGIEGTKLYKVY